jgi:hypothetical protein
MLNLKRKFPFVTLFCGRAINIFIRHNNRTSQLHSLIQFRAKQGWRISYVQNVRFFSENSSRRSDDKSNTIIDSERINGTTLLTRCINHFNNTAAVHGNASVITFLVLRNGTWYTLVALYSQLLTVGKTYVLGHVCEYICGDVLVHVYDNGDNKIACIDN